MRYIRLKCPKCGYTSEIELDVFNKNLRGYYAPYTCDNYGCADAEMTVDDVFDHNPIISEPISKVEKRNSL